MIPRRIAVVGALASGPYAVMAWMHMQIVFGFLRLGHDAARAIAEEYFRAETVLAKLVDDLGV